MDMMLPLLTKKKKLLSKCVRERERERERERGRREGERKRKFLISPFPFLSLSSLSPPFPFPFPFPSPFPSSSLSLRQIIDRNLRQKIMIYYLEPYEISQKIESFNFKTNLKALNSNSLATILTGKKGGGRGKKEKRITKK